MHLIIDQTLWKSRKKGSKAKQHKYIARFLVATSKGLKWKYVYPDDEDIASWDPHGGLQLKRTVASILNEKLFGSFGVNEKTGEPWVKPGLFVTYRPKLQHTIRERGLQGFPGYDVKVVGRWAFFKDKINPGFVQMELGHGIEKKYNVPQKVKDLYLKTQQEVDHALETRIGANIPEGGQPKLIVEHTATDVPSPDHKNIFVVPAQSESTKQALSVPKVKISDPPDWVVDKYGSIDKFQQEAASRPITTRVTLGLYEKQHAAKLIEEWGAIIYNVARESADAYKVTDNYSRFAHKDAIDERKGRKNQERTRSYLNEVISDLKQQGSVALYEALSEYNPSQSATDRFDKFAYAKIRAHIREYSRRQSVIEGASPYEVVHEMDVEEAERQAHRTIGGVQFLDPDELADLAKYTAPAKATLIGVLDDPTFPKTYKKVFLMRLWLEGMSHNHPVEQALREKRKDAGIVAQTWQRPWTGPNSIAEAQNEWVDPETGYTIRMSDVTRPTQLKYLKKFYDAAVENIHARMNQKERNMVARWLQLEAKLAGANRRVYTEDAKHQVRTKTLAEMAKPSKKGKRESLADAHPAIGFFTSNNQELARRLGLQLDAVDDKTRFTPGVEIGSRAKHQIATAEKYHAAVTEMHSWKQQKVASKISTVKKEIDKLSALVTPHKEGTPLDRLHQTARAFQSIDTDIRQKVASQRQLQKIRHTISDKEYTRRIKPLIVRESEKRAREKAHSAFTEAATAVGKEHGFPGAVHDIANAIVSRKTITPDHLTEHKAQAAHALHEAKTYMKLLDFERERRTALKETKKGGDVIDFFEAVQSLDFELGRLYAELAA